MENFRERREHYKTITKMQVLAWASGFCSADFSTSLSARIALRGLGWASGDEGDSDDHGDGGDDGDDEDDDPVCDTRVGTMLGRTSPSSHARGRKLPPPPPHPYIFLKPQTG